MNKVIKLLNKEKVVAEIEKLKRQLLRGACSSQISMETNCKEEAYDEVLSFLDTLEVKEVDLEEKATQLSQKYFPDAENIWARPNIEAHKCKSACIEMVEWFKENLKI